MPRSTSCRWRRLFDHPHGVDLGALKPNLAPRLKTANQRVQAAPAAILADLARFAALQAPAADELLMIGRRHVRSNNSWMHNYHRLVKGKPRHQLLMHPDDLASRGLKRRAAGAGQFAGRRDRS